jgi:hypothetical protein
MRAAVMFLVQDGCLSARIAMLSRLISICGGQGL